MYLIVRKEISDFGEEKFFILQEFKDGKKASKYFNSIKDKTDVTILEG